MLMIRLQRIGKKKKPTYRLVISEKARDPQARSLEILGIYNPVAEPKVTELKEDRIKYWLGQGAQASATVNNLLVAAGVITGDKHKSVSISNKRQAKIDEKKGAAEEAKKAAEEEAKQKAEAEKAAAAEAAAAPAEEEKTEDTPAEEKKEEVAPAAEEKAEPVSAEAPADEGKKAEPASAEAPADKEEKVDEKPAEEAAA